MLRKVCFATIFHKMDHYVGKAASAI